MPLTITPVPGAKSVSGTIREEFYDVTFDSSYSAEGEVITARDFGLMALYGISSVGSNSATVGLRVVFDYDTNKLYVEDGGTEASGSLTTATFRLRVTGI